MTKKDKEALGELLANQQRIDDDLARLKSESYKINKKKEQLRIENKRNQQSIGLITADPKHHQKSTKIRITEHAKVRYLERVMGIDVTKMVLEDIAGEIIEKLLETDGTADIEHPKGFTVRFIEYRAVTILAPNGGAEESSMQG